ncbi:hypothetical protein PV325_013906, partial [Microctonus aethiopoides]
IPLRVGKNGLRQLPKTPQQRLHALDCTSDDSQIDKYSSSLQRNGGEIGCHGHSCCQKILSELKSLKTMVSSIYLTVSNENDVPRTEEQIDFGLPMETSKQLTTFENKIVNSSSAAHYQKTVKQIGGLNFEKHVRNALVLTVSDILAYQMSWTGAKNTIMVKNMRFLKLITDVIEKQWDTANQTKIEAVIKSWLQHAGD